MTITVRARPATLACALLAFGTAAAHAPVTTTAQFDREIVHILDDHCVMCHQEGATAFPLVSYEQTYAARWKIRQSVLERRMPPWSAVGGYGDFENGNGLTQREIDFLVSWAESFGPRNNGEVATGTAVAAGARVIQARTDLSGWRLGEPDLRVALTAHEVLHVVLDPKLTQERWLRGLEFHPKDLRALRAVRFTVEASGEWLGSWTPWQGFVRYPPRLARRLPAGTRIAVDMDGAAAAGTLGLYFADGPSAAPVRDVVLTHDPQTLDQDRSVFAIDPQDLAGLRSLEVLARRPDGSQQVLLFARQVGPAWPTPYLLREPQLLPKGTVVSLIEHGTDPAHPAAQPVRLISADGALAQANAASGPPPAGVAAARFHLSGTVQSVDAAAGLIVVAHGDIPGLMGAMTMTYRAGAREPLQRVHPGDHIQAEVAVGEGTYTLENIR